MFLSLGLPRGNVTATDEGEDGQADEHLQSSLDVFANAGINLGTHFDDGEEVEKTPISDASQPSQQSKPVRTFEMPSAAPSASRPPTTDITYHDLGAMYPEAPVPDESGGVVLHRGVLNDLTGVAQLLDWVSDGDAAIVELTKIMGRETEFAASIERLSTFIEGDLGGQIIQLTDSRLLLLPPGCRGLRGVEMESFVQATEV